MKTLKERFKSFEDLYLNDERMALGPIGRRDVRAFVLLDRLLPGERRPIVGSAEHDEIWLDIDTEKLNEVIKDDEIVELLMCGVRYDSSIDSLGMFV